MLKIFTSMFIRDMDYMFPCGSTSSSKSLVHWFTREEDTEVGTGFRQAVDMTESPQGDDVIEPA